MSDKHAQAEAAKARGNTAFSAKNYAEAIKEYTSAIEAEPNHVLYSNRSASYAAQGKYLEALKDAEECVKLKPDFAKGWSRKGAALVGMRQWHEAAAAYETALKHEPGNAAAQEALKQVQEQLDDQQDIFGGPNMEAKLAADPRTASFAKDSAFQAKMKQIQGNPQLMGMYLKDPQVRAALTVLTGIDFAAMADKAQAAKGAGAAGAGPSMADEEEAEAERARETKRKEEAERQEAERKAKEEAERKRKEEEESDPEIKEKRAKQREAEQYRQKGNELYLKKQFEAALPLYQQALDLDPDSLSAMLNIAACHMEKKDYDQCVKLCEQAVSRGREIGAPFKEIGKAYLRMGNAHYYAKRWSAAIDAYQNSLLEDHSDKAKDMLKKAQQHKQQEEKSAYLDKAKSAEAKERGNKLFKDGKYIDAISEYSEAIKRDPDNPVNYSNRSACFQKVMDWQRALEDVETALKLDPKFVKAMMRKGKIEHFLKQYHKALDSFDKALELEPAGTDLHAEIAEAKRTTQLAVARENAQGKIDPRRQQEAMKDPEIVAILKDPTMQKVLSDFQVNPEGASRSLTDPTIKRNIEKLYAAGVLRVGGPGAMDE